MLSPSSSSPHHSPSTLPKIGRIIKPALTSEQEKAAKSTKICLSSTVLSQGDYLSIFKGLTVLFIGDNSVRTLYRHLCKALKYGRPLDCTEVARQNGKYKPIENEEILLSEGNIGTDSYRDIHKFHLVDKSIQLIYIYLNSILNDSGIQELHFIKDKDPSLSIDLVVFCSYTSDMNEIKIEKSNLTFDNFFNNYSIKLEYVLNYLIGFCRESNKKRSDFYWMSPLPQSTNMSVEKQQQFQQVLGDTDLIIKNNGFIKFDRYDIWQRRKDLLMPGTCHFSLHGIREIMDSFARTIGQKYNRSFTSSIPITSLLASTDTTGSSDSSSGGKWSKSTSSLPSHHYHPYRHHH